MTTQTVDSPVTATMFTRKMGEAMRQQSVCIEIPVTIQGSRNVPGDANGGTKTFIEESRTMIVFPMGAVVRFSEPVTEGQVLILKNLRMGREVACRVVCSKTSANVKGFVEVEFVQPAVGFWGISFPAPSSSAPAGSNSAAQSTANSQQPRPAGASPASMQSGSFRVPTMPPRTQTPAPSSVPQAPVPQQVVAPPPAASSAPTPVATAPSGFDLNSAIAAAYSAPVEPVRKAEPEVSVIPSGTSKWSEVLPSNPSTEVPQITVPVATADSIGVGDETGQVDLASLIAETQKEDLKIGEAAGDKHAKGAPAPVTSSRNEVSPSRASWTAAAVTPESSRHSAPASQKNAPSPIQSQTNSLAHASRGLTFGAEQAPAKSGRSGMLIGIVAIVVISIAGAGGYWWFSASRSASRALANSVPPAAAAVTPASNPPTATVPPNGPVQTPNTTTATQSIQPVKDAPGPKTTTNSGSNSQAASNRATITPATTNAPSPAPARRQNIIPGKIAAPTAPNGNAARSNNLATPDMTTPAPRTISTSPILGGMNSLPAPPPSPATASSAPTASVRKDPRLLSSVPAVYPKMASIRGDYGVVTVDAIVNEAGRVTSAKALSGPMTLRESAADAVMQQRYSPATLNGKPTSAHVTVNVEFKKKQ